MQRIGVQLTEVFAAAGLTDVGRRREKNEDSYLLRPEHGILIVADGLGGRPAGEVASRLGCETAFRSLMRAPSSSTLSDRMALAVTTANQAIWDESQADPDTAGMGTTVTSLLVDMESGQLGIGHVGDSRAYRFRDEKLERLTTDHTLVQELLEAGAIKPSDAEKHPLGYLLNRAVGTEPEVTPQVITQPALAGDLFLLCTDGLLAVLSEEEIACAVREGLAPSDGLHSAALQSIAERLVNEANDGGAPDNVTVGLLGIPR